MPSKMLQCLRGPKTITVITAYFHEKSVQDMPEELAAALSPFSSNSVFVFKN